MFKQFLRWIIGILLIEESKEVLIFYPVFRILSQSFKYINSAPVRVLTKLPPRFVSSRNGR